eukprot:9021070-Alexandrium_andersonii.AAC.1
MATAKTGGSACAAFSCSSSTRVRPPVRSFRCPPNGGALSSPPPGDSWALARQYPMIARIGGLLECR